MDGMFRRRIKRGVRVLLRHVPAIAGTVLAIRAFDWLVQHGYGAHVNSVAAAIFLPKVWRALWRFAEKPSAEDAAEQMFYYPRGSAGVEFQIDPLEAYRLFLSSPLYRDGGYRITASLRPRFLSEYQALLDARARRGDLRNVSNEA